MTQNNQQNDLKKFRTFGLTILQLMSVLALTGIVLGFVCWYFFKSV